MERFKKNNKIITIIIVCLFLIKTVQSCNRKMTIGVNEQNYKTELDSIKTTTSDIIDSLGHEIVKRDFIIIDLNAELKIAGVKATEAQKRAEAIQKTAESVKSHTTTTIEVKGVERDTILK